MKKASIIVAALLLTTAAFAQTKTVTKAPVAAANGMEFFHGTWAQALAKAKKENKLVFLDAYTSWCGPCKQMQRNVFPQTTVGSFF
jgi:thiol:disulfide interchange protein